MSPPRGRWWGVLLACAWLLGCTGDDADPPADDQGIDAAWLDVGVLDASPMVDAAAECPAIAPDCVAPDELGAEPPGWACPAGWSPVEDGAGCTPDAPPTVPDPRAGCDDPWPPPLIGNPWHVDPAAALDGADGSAERPFPTLAALLDAALNAEVPPSTILLADGEHPGDVVVPSFGLRKILGRCPARVTVVGGLGLGPDALQVAGVTVVAGDGAALTIEPFTEPSGAPTVRLEQVQIEGRVELANIVSAVGMSIVAPTGAAVRLTERGRASLRCEGCRIHAVDGPGIVSRRPGGTLDIGGWITTDAPGEVPAIDSAGTLRLTDSLLEAAGAVALRTTGPTTLERVAARTRTASLDPAIATLTVQPDAANTLLSFEDVVIDVPAGGLGISACCEQTARLQRVVVQGPGDEESVGLRLLSTALLVEDLAVRALGVGLQLHGASGELTRAWLSDIAHDGLLQTVWAEAPTTPGEVTVAGLVADRIGDAAVRVLGARALGSPPRGASVRLVDALIGRDRVHHGVRVEAGGQARVEAATFGSGSDVALVADDAELEAHAVLVDGASRAVVSRQGAAIFAEDLVIVDADEALIADDARLTVTRGLIADSVVGIVRRLAAAVTLRDVRLVDVETRERCDLVCTDRPPNRGAPPPLPE